MESSRVGACSVAALYAKKLCETSKSLTVKVVLHTQAAPGSQGTLPGTPKRALHGAPTVPTTRGSPDAIPGEGKGLSFNV